MVACDYEIEKIKQFVTLRAVGHGLQKPCPAVTKVFHCRESVVYTAVVAGERAQTLDFVGCKFLPCGQLGCVCMSGSVFYGKGVQQGQGYFAFTQVVACRFPDCFGSVVEYVVADLETQSEKPCEFRQGFYDVLVFDACGVASHLCTCHEK